MVYVCFQMMSLVNYILAGFQPRLHLTATVNTGEVWHFTSGGTKFIDISYESI